MNNQLMIFYAIAPLPSCLHRWFLPDVLICTVLIRLVFYLYLCIPNSVCPNRLSCYVAKLQKHQQSGGCEAETDTSSHSSSSKHQISPRRDAQTYKSISCFQHNYFIFTTIVSNDVIEKKIR